MRRTKTIEIEQKNFDIVCEVRRDGTVVEARMIVAHMEDNPLDCLEAVKNSNYFSRLAHAEYEELDWNDHGDSCIDELKSAIAPMLGVKHA